jgi:hypothetical protein
MKRLLVIALCVAATSAAAQDCGRLSDPMAYNACLASAGPAARKVHVGAAPSRAAVRAAPRSARVVTRRGRVRIVFSVR